MCDPHRNLEPATRLIPRLVLSRVCPVTGFDPLGVLTRAFITDVRPKLFDGQWKE